MFHRTTLVIFALVFALSSAAIAADQEASGVVNINTAGAEQLQLLPRVGPALASRIIDFREAHGPFGSVDELIAVKGIGETSFDKLAPFVTINGATTLETKVKLPRSNSGGQTTG